jgi:hypothetical protein
VIAPLAGSIRWVATSRLASCGMNFETGSVMRSLPSSTSIMAATDVNGLVIE